MPLFSDTPPAKVKPDAALDHAKKREAAKLTRRHCKNVLNAPKTARIGAPQQLITADLIAECEGQQSLF